MKCSLVKRALPLFFDGQLGEKKALEVKAHVEHCLSCKKELELLRGAWDFLNKWEPVLPSPDFKANFYKRLAQEETSRRSQGVFAFPKLKPRLIPLFATLSVALIIGAYFTNSFMSLNAKHLAQLTGDQDIRMLRDLELAEDFDVIQDINTLEDFELINSMAL